jgi:hypothetical protein
LVDQNGRYKLVIESVGICGAAQKMPVNVFREKNRRSKQGSRRHDPAPKTKVRVHKRDEECHDGYRYYIFDFLVALGLFQVTFCEKDKNHKVSCLANS